MNKFIDRNPRTAPWLAALVAAATSLLGSLLAGGRLVSETVEAVVIAVAVFAVVKSLR